MADQYPDLSQPNYKPNNQSVNNYPDLSQPNYKPSLQDIIPTFLGPMASNPVTSPIGSTQSFANPKTQESLLSSIGSAPTAFENIAANIATKGAPANLIQQALGNPLKSLGKGISSVLNPIDQKGLAYGVQKGYDTLKKNASDIYNSVKKQVAQRGIDKIELPEGLFDKAKKHLPDTDASEKLINDARSGDYNSLHELQSDLGQKGFSAKGAKDYAKRNLGDEMLEIRDKINDAITNKFKEYGHDDLANMLDEAKSKWAQLKDIYHSNGVISRLVGKDRVIPDNPLKAFSKDSRSMSRLRDAHPEIDQAINQNETAKNFMKGLKTTGAIARATGLGYGIYEGHNLLDLLKSNP